jgi:hypothetical protein
VAFFSLLLSGAFLWAATATATTSVASAPHWEVAAGNFGACADINDSGHWGYVLAGVKADARDSAVNFEILVVNLRCRPTVEKSDSVHWVIEWPSSRPGDPRVASQEHPRLASVAGYISEADSYRLARFSDDREFKPIERYELIWNDAGLVREIGELADGQSVSRSYEFALRGTYDKGEPDKKYYSYSGKFSVQVTWTKAGNQVSVSSWIQREGKK